MDKTNETTIEATPLSIALDDDYVITKIFSDGTIEVHMQSVDEYKILNLRDFVYRFFV